jgi:AcrR family transcriptional regulator
MTPEPLGPAAAPPPRPERPRPRATGAASRPRHDGVRAMKPPEVQRRRLLRETAAPLFAEFGVAAVGLSRVALVAGVGKGTAERCFLNRDELLYDLLGEHVLALNATVCTAFDAAAPEGPWVQLDAVVAAWLEHVARHCAAHRCLLFCAHLLVPDRRERVAIRLRVLMETMMEPLVAATPGLAARTAAVESLLATLASLLNDTGFWPEPPAAEARAERAQLITGMMRAAAAAVMAGGWQGLGGTGPAQVLDGSAVRARWREVLAAVGDGAEVVVTQRGKRVALVVRAG